MVSRPTTNRSAGLQCQHSPQCILNKPVIPTNTLKENPMNTVIYIVGLVVVIGLVLSFFGLR